MEQLVHLYSIQGNQCWTSYIFGRWRQHICMILASSCLYDAFVIKCEYFFAICTFSHEHCHFCFSCACDIMFLNLKIQSTNINIILWRSPGFNWAQSQQTRSTQCSCFILSDKQVLAVDKHMLSMPMPITSSVQRLYGTVCHICRDSVADSGVQHHQNCKWHVWLFKWLPDTTSEILKLPLCLKKGLSSWCFCYVFNR